VEAALVAGQAFENHAPGGDLVDQARPAHVDPVEVDDRYGAEWLPYQSATAPTPPFAEYTAGHSTIGAAGAEALRLFTGRDHLGASATVAAGTSGYEPGVPAQDVTLRWATFTEAAEQEGISRLYAGVHFTSGDTDGQSMGRRAAALVWERARALFAGQAEGSSGALPVTR
jgi:hypothetical protein